MEPGGKGATGQRRAPVAQTVPRSAGHWQQGGDVSPSPRPRAGDGPRPAPGRLDRSPIIVPASGRGAGPGPRPRPRPRPRIIDVPVPGDSRRDDAGRAGDLVIGFPADRCGEIVPAPVSEQRTIFRWDEVILCGIGTLAAE